MLPGDGDDTRSQYYHVFLVLDDKVYDFSQRGPKSDNLKTYLNHYLAPNGDYSENILLAGVIDRPKTIKVIKKSKVTLYKISKSEGIGEQIFTGNAMQIFNHSGATSGSKTSIRKALKKLTP